MVDLFKHRVLNIFNNRCNIALLQHEVTFIREPSSPL